MVSPLRALATFAALAACSASRPTASSADPWSSEVAEPLPSTMPEQSITAFEPCDYLANFYEDQQQRRAEYEARPWFFVPAEARAVKVPSGLELMGVTLTVPRPSDIQLEPAQLEAHRQSPLEELGFGHSVLRSVFPAAGIKALNSVRKYSGPGLLVFALRDPPATIAGPLEATLFRTAEDWACSGPVNPRRRAHWRAAKLRVDPPLWELASDEPVFGERPAVWVSLVPAQEGSVVTACVSSLEYKRACADFGLSVPKSELDLR
jgi:hypothetical protein